MDHRSTQRKLVGLLVKLAHKGLEEFAEKYATNLSAGGMFIRTREPRPRGTEIAFKVELADGQRVLQGIAVVRWARTEADPIGGPPGMGLEFLRLDPASRALVDRMVGKPSAPPSGTARPLPAVAPAVRPVNLPRAPPPTTTPAKGLPATALLPEPVADPDVFAALATSPRPEAEINLDLGALIAQTPQPPAPAGLGGAPGLEQASPSPRPQPATEGPVFLKDVTPSDGTGPIIGIDLGTTNAACAVLTKGRPLILSAKDGYHTVPSVVGVGMNGRIQVGRRAQAQQVLHPTQFVCGAKRLVGREYDSPTVKQVKERSHFEIVEGPQRRAAVKLGADVVSLEEIQALVLKECREMAEQALGTSVSRAVVTCPAYYSEPQREAVRRAGAMAGLKVERVLNEPTAAALAFGMNRELKKTVLVYDLGGGTFDATVLKLDRNVFEVLATGGDVFLGGVDFDNQLVDLLLERFVAWHQQPFSGERVALSRVSEAAEKVKCQLSERTSVEVHLPMIQLDAAGKALDLRTTVTRAELEAACGELVDRTIQAVQDVLLDAKLKPSEIDDIVLVGGMSRMPLVRERLKAMFKKQPHASVNADEAVALGAALYSDTVGKVSSLVLIDVVPMTLGLARPGGVFHRLIERNTPLPVTRSFGIATEKGDQAELVVMIFQGEDSNVAGNEFVGAVTITGLPRGAAGAVKVAVTLCLDAECVLKVEAREFSTRKVVQATLATRYTSEELAQKLGLSVERRAAANKSRGDELTKRAGGFWGKLKSTFSR